jgi:hypothetical protein
MKRHMEFCWIPAVLILIFTGSPTVCQTTTNCARAQSSEVQVVEAPSLSDAEPPQFVKPRQTVADAQGTAEPTMRDVMEELSRVRKEVVRLGELLDAHLSSEAADLHAENERLRREVRDLSIRKGRGLPMPDKELLRGLSEPEPTPPHSLSNHDKLWERPEELGSREEPAQPVEESPDAAERPAFANPPPPAEFKHEILEEWGRTPTEAAKSVPKVGSLKGMICVVPPGSLDDDLIALAQKLHKEFEMYDNINIEVFDDAAAARAFKDNKISPSAPSPADHRVLSVSKHMASGRDAILLIKGKQVIEVPPQE